MQLKGKLRHLLPPHGLNYNNNYQVMQSLKNSNMTNPALLKMAIEMFTLEEPLPPVILDLLTRKMRNKLSDRENKEIYDQLKENNVIPSITNPKSLVELASAMNICTFRAGRTLVPDGDCHILLQGMVKVYKVVSTQVENFENSEIPTGNILENDIRVSVINISNKNKMKIERNKINIGEVINYLEPSSDPLVFEALSPGKLLTIQKDIYEPIVVSAYLAKVKKQQQFFNKISLLEKHYRSSLQDFINACEEVKYKFGQKVFSEGEVVSNVYIIKEGEFILEKNICSEVQVHRGRLVIRKKTEQEKRAEIRKSYDHFRVCPYKIVHAKETFGDYEFDHNHGVHMNTLRCHQEGSIAFQIRMDTFLKLLIVPENPIERVAEILKKKYRQKKKEIERGVKFNQTNEVILRCLPNSTIRHNTQMNESSREKSNGTCSKQTKNYHHRYFSQSELSHEKANKKIEIETSLASNQSFFETINKTIRSTSHRTKSFRKRKDKSFDEIFDGSIMSEAEKKKNKVPAAIQDIVQIVNLKKEYHKLRKLGNEKKGIFEFNVNNVPAFIKKKYAHILKSKPI